MARGEASASVAEVQEMDALAEAEQQAADAATPPEIDVPESVSEEVSTESLAEMVEMEHAPMTEDGHIMPPLGATAETDAEGAGRGLLNGEFARMGDGSVVGVAAVADVQLSVDVPQFKRTARGDAASEDGTTHKLSGKYRKDAPPITVWRRTDGRLEVITGRHRLAHARANDMQYIAVRVYDEDVVHDAKWAKLYDVEQNILDRQASVQDVAYFFRNTNMTETEAAERGLMPKAENGENLATGTMGITIARRACEEVYTRFMNGALTRSHAYFIATLGVDEKGQVLAAQMLDKKKPMDWVKAYVHEAETARAANAALQQFDLFGMDESWAQEAAKVADYVAKARRQVREQIGILEKAGSLKDKAELAKKLGVKLKTGRDVQRRLETLTLLDARLESMDSSLSLGGRAAAWDGKSAVDVEELAKAGRSTMALSLSPSGIFMVENDNVGLAEHLEDEIDPIEINFEPIKLKGKEKKAYKQKLVDEALAFLISIAGDRPIGNTGYTLRIADSKNRGKRTTYNVDKQARSEAFHRLEEVIAKAYRLSSALPKNRENESVERKSKLARTATIERFGYPVIINKESCIIWFTAQTRNAGDRGVLLDEFGVTERKNPEAASRLSVSRTKFQEAAPGKFTLGDYLINVNDELRDLPKITVADEQTQGGTTMSLDIGMQEMASVRACVEELAAGKKSGVLRNTAWGQDIHVPHGKIGSKGYGVDHIQEMRILQGFTPEEAAFIIVCALKVAEIEKNTYKQGNKVVFERWGIRAVVNPRPTDGYSILTGFILDTVGAKEAVDSEAAQLATHFYALDDLSRNQEVGAALTKSVARLEEIIKQNPTNWEQIVELEIEMLRIKQNAKADGTYMLAPNGKPTNLTEHQWAQVRTQAFKNFFGDWEKDPENASKVLDENGEPLVVYHGTPATFTRFKPSEDGALGAGIYTTAFEHLAKGPSQGGNIMHLFLNIRNPYEALYPGGIEQDKLIAKGYDGVYNPSNQYYVAFNPEQVKSATDNRGTFDPGNADITMSLALDNGVAAMRGAAGVSAKEEAMQKLLRSVERAREQWAAPWKGSRHDRERARGHLMGLAMGIYRALPPGYKVQLDPLLRRGAVLERMIADGKLTGHGQVSKDELAELNDAVLERLEETWQEQVGEYELADEYGETDERRSRGGVNTTRVTKKEQQRLWREAAKEATARVGMERMEEIYREIAEAAAAQVKAYLKDAEVQKLDTLLDRYTPKVDKKTRRLKPGATDAAFYKEVKELRLLMDAEPEVREAKMQSLIAQLEPLQAKGDGLTPAEEVQRDALDAELADWTVFGSLGSRGFMDVRKARELLGARAAMRRGLWQARKEAETARLRALMSRAVRGMGAADENRIARQQEEYKQSSWQQFKGLPVYAMSIAQLMDSMSEIPGLGGFAAECRDALAAGHLGLMSSENGLYAAMSSFLTQLGLEKPREKAEFLEHMQKLEQTDIAPLADVVRVDEEVSVEDAERWLAMSAAEREEARAAWDVNPQGAKPLPEGAMPALRAAYEENKTGAWSREKAELRAELSRAQGQPGAVNRKPHEPKPSFRVQTEFRPVTKKGKLRISRNQALNVLLLCEQPRYMSNADSHGFTADVLAQLREFVGEDVMRFGYWMREYMSNSGLAEVYEAREGVPFPAEEYYWTGHFDRTADMSDKTALDAQVSTMSGKYGMLKTRVDHDLTFDLSLGATNVFMGTMAQQFNYIHMGGLTAKWRRMLANRVFATSLRAYLGEARFRALKDGINLLDMQGVVEATAQRTISTLIGKVQSVHAPAVLAGSVTTIMKQLSATMHAASCPGVSVVQLLPQLLADRFGAGRMTYGKMLRERAFAERVAHNEARRQVYTDMLELGSDVTWSRLAELSRMGMATLEWVDVRSNVVSMVALYNILWRRMEKENRETGGAMSEEEMHAACMQAVETTLDQAMMPTLMSQRSLVQAYGGNGVFGKLNMYMGGEVLNKFGLVVRNYHKAGGGVRGMLKAAPFLMTMSMAEQAMMMLIDLLRGKEPDEEEDWAMWWCCNLATGISGLGLLNGVPLLGELLSHVSGGYVRSNTLAKAMGLDVIGSGKRLWKMATDDREYGAEDWFLRSQNFLRPFTSIFGGWSGGVHSTSRFFSEATGLLQSLNAAMNAVRPAAENVKNRG